MSTLRIDPNAPPTILTMGLGSVVTAHTDFGGMPGVVLVPAKNPGPIDADASAELPDGAVVPENAIVIRFASADAALAHLDLLRKAVTAFFARARGES